ncbi:MAG: ATP-dependent helicase, partial [Cellulomonas sp.]|nr:ATP-dependent helicase [Cellulomonas sp.]
MAQPGRRRSGGARPNPGAQRRRAPRPAERGILPVLAQVAHEVDSSVQRPPTRPAVRTKFQVVALLVRQERARVMADGGLSEARRAEQLKRLDGVATLLARTAARDTSLLTLLGEEARVSDAARAYKATLMRAGGLEPSEEPPPPPPAAPVAGVETRV